MGDGGFGGGSGRGNAGVNAVGGGKGTWSTRSGGVRRRLAGGEGDGRERHQRDGDGGTANVNPEQLAVEVLHERAREGGVGVEKDASRQAGRAAWRR
eukprot:5199967-Prymnesium_polylepis.1